MFQVEAGTEGRAATDEAEDQALAPTEASMRVAAAGATAGRGNLRTRLNGATPEEA